MTVTAQQIQKDSDFDDMVTFRKWNPNKIYTTIGSDNSNQAQPVCPVACIGWFALERLLFPVQFEEAIDYCRLGEHSFDKVLQEYSDKLYEPCKTTTLRICSFLINWVCIFIITYGLRN